MNYDPLLLLAIFLQPFIVTCFKYVTRELQSIWMSITVFTNLKQNEYRTWLIPHHECYHFPKYCSTYLLSMVVICITCPRSMTHKSWSVVANKMCSTGSLMTASLARSSTWLLWLFKVLIHISSICLVVIIITCPAYICVSWVMICLNINYCIF